MVFTCLDDVFMGKQPTNILFLMAVTILHWKLNWNIYSVTLVDYIKSSSYQNAWKG